MVYVHIPFCRSFCTYCGFYSELSCRGCDPAMFERYTEGLLDEIAARRDEILGTTGTNTLYIGGGTPSVLPSSCMDRIVNALKGIVPLPLDEFTVEVNPDDITGRGAEYTGFLRELGVSRISMGVQSLDDRMLRWMNRRHDAAGARKAFDMVREAGFDNVSVDVIFGISPAAIGGASAAGALESTLKEIISWRPEHISAYQLSVEEGSALDSLVRSGRYAEAEDELCRKQYEMICRMLQEAGYTHYEVSNWALPGFEARHNSAYWTRVPYVGLGPGAHSLDRSGTVRSWNTEDLSAWTREEEVLGPDEVMEERIMLGLRTGAGIPASLLRDEGLAAKMAGDGLLERSGDRIRIPESAMFVSDDIISSLA